MSQAEELLNNISSDDISLHTTKPEVEEHIVIDNDRKITVPKALQRIAVQYDHNIETVTFDCPRYWDNHDLSSMYIYINYLRSDRVRGRYLAKNVVVDSEDSNIIHFDWTIGNEITIAKGKVMFLVCAVFTNEEGNEELHWNSELNHQMIVSDGLECTEALIDAYPDIITDLLTRMDGVVAANVPIIDKTLSQSGLAADAMVIGKAIEEIKIEMDEKGIATGAVIGYEGDKIPEGFEEVDDIHNDVLNIIDAEVTARKELENTLQNEIKVERERINNLASLPEGSTTGDAELIDTRVGGNGVTYKSAGEAVRGQYNELKTDTNALDGAVFETIKSPNLFDKSRIQQNKFIITWETTTLSDYAYDKDGWFVSAPIEVTPGSTIYFYGDNDGEFSPKHVSNISEFDKDGNFIKNSGNVYSLQLSSETKYVVFDCNDLTASDYFMVTNGEYAGDYQAYYIIKNSKIEDNLSKINEVSETANEALEKANKALNKDNKTHIIFSFDAFKIDNRFDLMKTYGFPFTIAISQTSLDYPISKEDYYKYFINGDVDFSVYAGVGDRPADYLADEEAWNNWVLQLVEGLEDGSGLYYPVMYSCQNNASSDILNNVVKKYGFKMCRYGVYYGSDDTVIYTNYTDRGYLIDDTNNFDYCPISVVKDSNYPTVDQIKSEIDKAIVNGKSIMLFTHYVVDDAEEMSDTDCPLSKFTEILDYVKNRVDLGLCDVKNARQFWNFYHPKDGAEIDYKRTNMRNYFDTNNV